jgi:hypothetical protein
VAHHVSHVQHLCSGRDVLCIERLQRAEMLQDAAQLPGEKGTLSSGDAEAREGGDVVDVLRGKCHARL